MFSFSKEFARSREAVERFDDGSQFIRDADFDTFKEGVHIEVKYIWQSLKEALSSIEELQAENKKLREEMEDKHDWTKYDIEYLVSLSYQNPETKDKIRDMVNVLFDKYLIELPKELTGEDRERFDISKYDAIRALPSKCDVSYNLLWCYICCHPKFKGESREMGSGEDDLIISGYRWDTNCLELMQRVKRMKGFVIERLE